VVFLPTTPRIALSSHVRSAPSRETNKGGSFRAGRKDKHFRPNEDDMVTTFFLLETGAAQI